MKKYITILTLLVFTLFGCSEKNSDKQPIEPKTTQQISSINPELNFLNQLTKFHIDKNLIGTRGGDTFVLERDKFIQETLGTKVENWRCTSKDKFEKTVRSIECSTTSNTEKVLFNLYTSSDFDRNDIYRGDEIIFNGSIIDILEITSTSNHFYVVSFQVDSIKK